MVEYPYSKPRYCVDCNLYQEKGCTVYELEKEGQDLSSYECFPKIRSRIRKRTDSLVELLFERQRRSPLLYVDRF